jgi:hypothetical protein
VKLDVSLLGYVALVVGLLFSYVCAYRFGKYIGWIEVFEKYALYEKAGMTLKEGETLVGVVDMKKGQYFFIGTNASDGSNLNN